MHYKNTMNYAKKKPNQINKDGVFVKTNFKAVRNVQNFLTSKSSKFYHPLGPLGFDLILFSGLINQVSSYC